MSRRTLFGLSAVCVVLAAWAGAASWQILARTDPGSIWSAAELRYAYEDRISHLTDRLEREVTRNLVERSAFEARVEAIAGKQAEIEARQGWLRDVAGRVTRGEAPSVPRAPEARSDVLPGTSKPAPLPGEPQLRLREGAEAAPAKSDRLSTIEQSLNAIGTDEIRIMAALGQSTRSQVARLRSAIDATGIDVERARPMTRSAMGGPLVPLPAGPQAGHFGALASEIDLGFAELAHLSRTARSLPLGAPLAQEAEQTSGFGYRTDPFTRGAALHTGIDFRSETGASALATGAGTVVSAEYAGGYGLMVEIEHGPGISTRYGHLSAILVTPGQRVEAGQPVGLTGSTGRSTGPHLHYETRLNGEPVNPNRFLDAGRLLRTDLAG